MFKVVNKVLDEQKNVIAFDVVDENEVSYTLSKNLLVLYLERKLIENARVYTRQGKEQIQVTGGYGTRIGDATVDDAISYSKTYYSLDGLVLSCDDLPLYIKRGLVSANSPIFIKVADYYRAVGRVQDYVDVMLEHYFYEYIKKTVLWKIHSGGRKCLPGRVNSLNLQKLFPKKYMAKGDFASVEAAIKASSYALLTDDCSDALYTGIDDILQSICKKEGVRIYSLRCNGIIKYYGVSTNCASLLGDFCKGLYAEAAISGKPCLTCKGFYKNLDFHAIDDPLQFEALEFRCHDLLNFALGFDSSVHADEYPYKSVTFSGDCTVFLADLSSDLSKEGITQKLYSKFLFNRSNDSKRSYNVFESFDLILKGVEKDDIVIR